MKWMGSTGTNRLEPVRWSGPDGRSVGRVSSVTLSFKLNTNTLRRHCIAETRIESYILPQRIPYKDQPGSNTIQFIKLVRCFGTNTNRAERIKAMQEDSLEKQSSTPLRVSFFLGILEDHILQ